MDYELTSAVLFVVACVGWAVAMAAMLSASVYRKDGRDWCNASHNRDKWLKRAVAAEEKLAVLESIFNQPLDPEPSDPGSNC